MIDFADDPRTPTEPGLLVGDPAFGLEPLVLPPVHDDFTSDGHSDAAFTSSCLELLESISEGPDRGTSGSPIADDVFWFRWITGHQVSFIVWRLASQCLDHETTDAGNDKATAHRLASYVRAYAAMLLYTGSCPVTVYHRLIRPTMRRQHPAFSGSWAPDFQPVRPLFRMRKVPSFDGGGVEVAEALRMQDATHDCIAARLVPDGKSLLRQSTVPPPANSRLTGMFYDTYFLTVRDGISRQDVAAQLVRRVVAICRDVHRHGLTAPADDPPTPSREPISDLVADCADNFHGILLDAARAALFVPELDPVSTGTSAPQP